MSKSPKLLGLFKINTAICQKGIYMAIDVTRLMKGEDVNCDKCKKGKMKPRFTDEPQKASSFVCSECGMIIRLNFKMPKPSD